MLKITLTAINTVRRASQTDFEIITKNEKIIREKLDKAQLFQFHKRIKIKNEKRSTQSELTKRKVTFGKIVE